MLVARHDDDDEFGEFVAWLQIFERKCTSSQKFIWCNLCTCDRMSGLTDCFVDRRGVVFSNHCCSRMSLNVNKSCRLFWIRLIQIK